MWRSVYGYCNYERGTKIRDKCNKGTLIKDDINWKITVEDRTDVLLPDVSHTKTYRDEQHKRTSVNGTHTSVDAIIIIGDIPSVRFWLDY